MRLAIKLVLVFMLANIVLAGIYGYLAVRREVDLFKKRAQAEAEAIAPVIVELLDDEQRLADQQKVANEKLLSGRDLLATFAQIKGDGEIQKSLDAVIQSLQTTMSIRWVSFEAKAGEKFRPKVPSLRVTSIVAIEIEEPDGNSNLEVYWPVTLANSSACGLEFTLPESELVANQRDIIRRTALLIAGMLVISGLLAILFGVRFVGRPLDQLIAKARRIGGGDLTGPVHLRSRDELAELAEDLNALCSKLAESETRLRQETAARITALEQLRHADRLQTVGRLASGIAHELGTPLNVITGRAALICSGKLDAEQVAQSAAAIKVGADKMTTIIRQLLDFARASAPRKLPVDLRTVIRQTIDMIHSIAEKQNVQLIFQQDSKEAVAEIDAGQIQQVFTNLTINAIQAMPNGGEVRFSIAGRTGRSSDGGGDGPSEFYAIEVRDQGIGIPEENLQHLFEPFFTTKEIGAGTGLGLSIAYGIVQEHGGWIDVASRMGEGSCFTVFLPRKADSQ